MNELRYEIAQAEDAPGKQLLLDRCDDFIQIQRSVVGRSASKKPVATPIRWSTSEKSSSVKEKLPKETKAWIYLLLILAIPGGILWYLIALCATFK